MTGAKNYQAIVEWPENHVSENGVKSQTISEIFNQRWMLLVCQHLARGPVRFNELAKATGINPNTLRERLRELEDLGLVSRRVLSTMPPKVEYSFTGSTEDLVPIIQAFEKWLKVNTIAQSRAAV